MAGHVVGSFERVGVACGVIGHEPLEKGVEVGAGCGVGILVDHEAGAGVLDEHCDCAFSYPAAVDDVSYGWGDVCRAFAPGAYGERGCGGCHDLGLLESFDLGAERTQTLVHF